MKGSLLKTGYDLIVHSLSAGTNSRIIVITLIDAVLPGEMEKVANSNVVLIGGSDARNELRHFLTSTAAARFVFTPPLSSRTEQALRRFVGIPAAVRKSRS